MKCCCCGKSFKNTPKKPQDPQRDRGYGWCYECRAEAIKDWICDGMTIEQANKRWEKYYGR